MPEHILRLSLKCPALVRHWRGETLGSPVRAATGGPEVPRGNHYLQQGGSGPQATPARSGSRDPVLGRGPLPTHAWTRLQPIPRLTRRIRSSPNGVRTRVSTLREWPDASKGFALITSDLVKRTPPSRATAAIRSSPPNGWTKGWTTPERGGPSGTMTERGVAAHEGDLPPGQCAYWGRVRTGVRYYHLCKLNYTRRAPVDRQRSNHSKLWTSPAFSLAARFLGLPLVSHRLNLRWSRR